MTPIDHIPISRHLAEPASVVDAWEGTEEGLRLSDHSGLVVAVAR